MKYKDIKDFAQRCEEHPAHQNGMVSYQMIQARLDEEIAELREYIETQLAQPKQEPVAAVTSETGADISMSWWHEPALPVGTKLYTTPPQRTWVGLSLADKEEYLALDFGGNRLDAMDWAEKRLNEKNT